MRPSVASRRCPTRRGRPDPRRGVAAVEFAVVLAAILMPLMIGTWEMGRAIQVQQIVANAAREGARLAAQGRTVNQTGIPTQITKEIDPASNPTNLPNVRAVVFQSLVGAGLKNLVWSDVTVVTTYTPDKQPWEASKNEAFTVYVVDQLQRQGALGEPRDREPDQDQLHGELAHAGGRPVHDQHRRAGVVAARGPRGVRVGPTNPGDETMRRSLPSPSAARPLRARRRGATTVEAAFVLPIFLLFIMGIYEYGRYLMVLHVSTNAARDGARLAVVRAGTSTDPFSPYTGPLVPGEPAYGGGRSVFTVPFIEDEVRRRMGKNAGGEGVYTMLAQFGVRVYPCDTAQLYATPPTFVPKLDANSATNARSVPASWKDARFTERIAVRIVGTYKPVVAKLLFMNTDIPLIITCTMGSES